MIFASPVLAGDAGGPHLALDRYAASDPGEWSLLWSPHEQAPSFVSGQGHAPIAGWKGNRAAAVEALFRRHRDLFGLREGVDNLQVSWAVERRGRHHYRLAQSYRGVPVPEGEYAVALDPSGALRMINGAFCSGIAVDVHPSIPLTEARGNALRAVEGAAPGDDRKTRLVVVEAGDGHALAWETEILDPNGIDRHLVRIDAHRGDVLSVLNTTLHYPPRHDPLEPPPPWGDVFESDPNDPVSTVALPGLNHPHALCGERLAVFNDETSTGPNASPNLDGHFRFDPSDPHFTEVNAYYHIERFLNRFLPPLGFAGLGYQMIVRVNGDSLWHVFAAPELHLTYIGGGRRYGHLVDVLVHEAAHHVTYSYGFFGALLPEAAAMFEGLSDYFAAAYTSDPSIFEYYYPGCSAGGPGQTWVDSDPNVYKYSNWASVQACGTDITHARGMILSGALWDLRGAVGPIVDRLVLEALDYMPGTGTYGCMSNAMVQADIDLHGAEHLDQIVAAFAEREIAGPVGSISGPANPTIGTQPTYAVSPTQCCLPPVSYLWLKRGGCAPECLPTACADTWSFVGTGEGVAIDVVGDFEIQVSGSDAVGRLYSMSRIINAWHGAAPTVELSGPDPPELGEGEVAHFSATATGVGLEYAWSRREVGYVIGQWLAWPYTGPTIDVVLPDGDWEVRVEVTDDDCRSAEDKMVVHVAGGGPVASEELPGLDADHTIVAGRAEVGFRATSTVEARLSVLDVAGRRVATVWSGEVGPQGRRVTWDAGGLPSGVYYYRLSGAGLSHVKRFVVLK